MKAFENTDKDARSGERHRHEVSVWCARLNTGSWLEAKTLNYSIEGMCVKSNVRFRPGTALLIRIDHWPPDVSYTGTFTALPTMTLGEVKWCRELSEKGFSSYDIGIKYFAPEY